MSVFIHFLRGIRWAFEICSVCYQTLKKNDLNFFKHMGHVIWLTWQKHKLTFKKTGNGIFEYKVKRTRRFNIWVIFIDTFNGIDRRGNW